MSTCTVAEESNHNEVATPDNIEYGNNKEEDMSTGKEESENVEMDNDTDNKCDSEKQVMETKSHDELGRESPVMESNISDSPTNATVNMNQDNDDDLSGKDIQTSTQTSSGEQKTTDNSDKTQNPVDNLSNVVNVEKAGDDNGQTERDVYRNAVDSETSTDSDSDSSSSSDDEISDSETKEVETKGTNSREQMEGKGKDKGDEVMVENYQSEIIKTKGELYPEDLPPMDELKITIDPNVELMHTGNVTSVVGILVIIQSNKNIPALNEDTILFLEGRVVMGQIFEVFGPVGTPWYSVRFNSVEDIGKLNIQVGTQVYCAPKVEEFTHYVFVEQLKRIRGSDASWEDNNEPPGKYMDFSDDEEEKRFKNKSRNKEKETEDGEVLPGARKIRRRKKQETNGVREETNQDFSWSNKGHQRGHMRGQFRGNPRQSHHDRFCAPQPQYQTFQPFGPSPRYRARMQPGPQRPQQGNGPLRPPCLTMPRQNFFLNPNQECRWNGPVQGFQGNNGNFNHQNDAPRSMNVQQVHNQYNNLQNNPHLAPRCNTDNFQINQRHRFGQQNFPPNSAMPHPCTGNSFQTGPFHMNRSFTQQPMNQRLMDHRLIQNVQSDNPPNSGF